MALLRYRLASGLLGILPGSVSGWLGKLFAKTYALFPSSKKKLVQRNLKRTSGAEPGSKRVRKTFVSYANYYIDGSRLPRISKDALDKKFAVRGYEHIEKHTDSKSGGFILALPHMGSWEWAGAWLAKVKGQQVTAVVEPFESPKMQDWISSHRKKFGINVIFLSPKAGPQLIKALNQGHAVCLLSDRYISGAGVSVNFFGEETTLPAGPATLALRTQSPIFPVGIYSRDGIICAEVRPPLITEREKGLREDVQRITEKLTEELEHLIRMSPEDWHLMSPNWPSDSLDMKEKNR